jgi:hypothetical protein
MVKFVGGVFFICAKIEFVAFAFVTIDKLNSWLIIMVSSRLLFPIFAKYTP